MTTLRSLAISILLFTLFSPLFIEAKTVTLPRPTGTYAVSRRSVRWVDASRDEVMVPRHNQKREVVVWFWYPATNTPGAKPAPFIDQLDQLARALPRDAVSLARSAESFAVSQAPVAEEPPRFPVILFSPGAGTVPALYSSLFEDLASHGYVIVAVDHPYDDLAVVLSDGRVVKQAKQPNGGEELLRFQRQRVTVRTQDLRFVLDQLERVADGRVADPLRGRLDLAQIGALGHSVGGMTAAELCKYDRRVLACANMDGVVSALPVYTEDAPQGLERPFLFLEKPFLAMKGEKPEDAQRRLAFLREKGNAILSGVRSGTSYRVTITGATHATFSDEEFLESQGGKEQTRLLALVRSYLRAFFDKSIRNLTATVLDVPPTDASVRVQTFTPK
jgi:predicted dienelactone hydrolase